MKPDRAERNRMRQKARARAHRALALAHPEQFEKFLRREFRKLGIRRGR